MTLRVATVTGRSCVPTHSGCTDGCASSSTQHAERNFAIQHLQPGIAEFTPGPAAIRANLGINLDHENGLIVLPMCDLRNRFHVRGRAAKNPC
jgi:hypothetical protein